jgi:hypothetical protein
MNSWIEANEFTLMVASSLPETSILKTGWNATDYCTLSEKSERKKHDKTELTVMGLRWPVNENFGGALGSSLFLVPRVSLLLTILTNLELSSRCWTFASSSMTFFCKRMTEVHFFSSKPACLPINNRHY